MRQGYIDSQGNKYILTGVKAQFPRWTYAEWQAEGEPDIPWIRKDAPSGYRKVSGNDVSYDNNTSVNSKIDTVNNSVKIKNYFSLSNSDFTWSDTYKAFVSNQTIQTIIGTKALLGFSAWFTNGGAIANARYNRNNQKIHVEGWIPTAGAVVNSNYEFTLVIYTN